MQGGYIAHLGHEQALEDGGNAKKVIGFKMEWMCCFEACDLLLYDGYQLLVMKLSARIIVSTCTHWRGLAAMRLERN